MPTVCFSSIEDITAINIGKLWDILGSMPCDIIDDNLDGRLRDDLDELMTVLREKGLKGEY